MATDLAHDIEGLWGSEDVEEALGLAVQFGSVVVGECLDVRDNTLVRLRHDGDQEVHQDDQVEELVEEPQDPDDVDHPLGVTELLRFIRLLHLLPVFVLRSTNITNRISVSLEVEWQVLQSWVVLTTEGNAWDFEQNAKDQHPNDKEEEEDLNVVNATHDKLNEAAEILLYSKEEHELHKSSENQEYMNGCAIHN